MLKIIAKKMLHTLQKKHKITQAGEIPKEYFKKFLPSNPVIVEAGAHIGLDTVEMAKLWRRGTIYAFEPVPDIYEQLIKATKGFKNIFCHPLALSNQVGTSKIFLSSGSSDASSSLLAPKDHLIEHPSVNFSNNIQIQTTTLDQWALENGVNYVDFMWLDMQGYEPFALKTSPRILSTVKAIYTEVSLKQLYEGTPLYPEFRQWLEKQGFRVEREELAWSDAGNVLFVREKEY